ncbi:MAG: zinc ribbon domain-containing protein [Planctomycetota bacterium]|jgi:hypothetical protein
MTGPHPLPPDDERALKTTHDESLRENAMGATFQAMAEALRTNAEALHKIDSSQRQMADSLRKSDKVTQVVTSTKALNETFRGLGEIQRGLLETLVKDRNGRGGTSPIAFLVIALLAGLLSILVWERMTDDGRLPRELYEEARHQSASLSAQLATAGAREKELDDLLRAAEIERNDLRLEQSKDAAELKRLNGELERNQAQMGNFLKAKEQAAAAGALMLSNEQLNRENDSLRGEVQRLKAENQTMWKKMAEGVVEGRMGDPQRIIDAARNKGVIPEEAAKTAPNTAHTARDLTLIRRRLKRLLEGAKDDQGYELLMLKGVEDGSRLTEIEVGRYEKHLSVGSIVCKQLEVRVDAAKDAVELRFKDGYIANLNKPGEKIPLDPEGHSVFIPGVGVKNWLAWAGPSVSVEPGGLLKWN